MADFGTIKSLLHFDEDLKDEVSSEIWNFAGGAYCTTRAQDELGTNIFPKFGEKIVGFSGNNADYVYCNNTSTIFNINRSIGDYEFEAFIYYKGYIERMGTFEGVVKTITGQGNIFTLGDLVLGINSSAQLTLLGETSTATITNEWQHVLLRLNKGAAKVFLDGTEILSTVLSEEHYIPSIVKLGGYDGVMDEFVFRQSIGETPPEIPTKAYGEETIESGTMIENGVLQLSGAIQLRGGTFAALSSENPLLARREIAVEIDTGRIKVGDGVNNWNDLPYAGISPPSSDNKVYVMKNGAWVEATLVAQPSEWSPAINDAENIVLTVDADMTPYQFTGTNTEVTGSEA